MLAERLGTARAGEVIAGIFGERRRMAILEACAGGRPERALRPLRRRCLWSWRLRRPWRLLRCVMGDGLRLARRWLHPEGLRLTLSGADAGGGAHAGAAARVASWLGPLFETVEVRPGARRAGWWATRRLLARTGLVIQEGHREAAADLVLPAASTPRELLDQLARRFARRHARWVTEADGL